MMKIKAGLPWIPILKGHFNQTEAHQALKSEWDENLENHELTKGDGKEKQRMLIASNGLLKFALESH